MEMLTRQRVLAPNLADSTARGSITLRPSARPTGIVVARARIHGRPVAYTHLRSTYMHELDSAVGFYLFNDPAPMRNPQNFMHAANEMATRSTGSTPTTGTSRTSTPGTTRSGRAHTDPLFPTWSPLRMAGPDPERDRPPGT